jgi:hypothetical protein
MTDEYDIDDDKYKELVSMPAKDVHEFFQQMARRKEAQNDS